MSSMSKFDIFKNADVMGVYDLLTDPLFNHDDNAFWESAIQSAFQSNNDRFINYVFNISNLDVRKLPVCVDTEQQIHRFLDRVLLGRLSPEELQEKAREYVHYYPFLIQTLYNKLSPHDRDYVAIECICKTNKPHLLHELKINPHLSNINLEFDNYIFDYMQYETFVNVCEYFSFTHAQYVKLFQYVDYWYKPKLCITDDNLQKCVAFIILQVDYTPHLPMIIRECYFEWVFACLGQSDIERLSQAHNVHNHDDVKVYLWLLIKRKAYHIIEAIKYVWFNITYDYLHPLIHEHYEKDITEAYPTFLCLYKCGITFDKKLILEDTAYLLAHGQKVNNGYATILRKRLNLHHKFIKWIITKKCKKYAIYDRNIALLICKFISYEDVIKHFEYTC